MAKQKPTSATERKMKAHAQSTAAAAVIALRRERKRLTEIKRLSEQLQRDRVRAERALNDLAHAVAEDSGHRLVARGMLEELETDRAALGLENVALRREVLQLRTEKHDREHAQTADASTR